MGQFGKPRTNPRRTRFPSSRHLRHRPPIPATSRRRTGLFFFASTRRVQRRSQLVQPTPVEREAEERRSGSADDVFRFRPRRRTRPVSLASSEQGEHVHGLSSLNHQLRRENRRKEIPTVPADFFEFRRLRPPISSIEVSILILSSSSTCS